MPDLSVDPDRGCELCGGPILATNLTGVCRTTPRCILENNSRRNVEAPEARSCNVCGGPLSKRNSIGICRMSAKCRKTAKKEHDKRYHQNHKEEKAAKVQAKIANGIRPHRQTTLLPEDGIIDEVAIYIVVNGIRKVALTHRERVEATRLMLLRGCSIREMCDNLHIQPSVVRKILDELGFECVRNEHIAGSKIMVILPKDRKRGPKLLSR